MSFLRSNFAWDKTNNDIIGLCNNYWESIWADSYLHTILAKYDTLGTPLPLIPHLPGLFSVLKMLGPMLPIFNLLFRCIIRILPASHLHTSHTIALPNKCELRTEEQVTILQIASCDLGPSISISRNPRDGLPWLHGRPLRTLHIDSLTIRDIRAGCELALCRSCPSPASIWTVCRLVDLSWTARYGDAMVFLLRWFLYPSICYFFSTFEGIVRVL